MIFGPRIAPHSQVFSQILQVLHSDQRLILKTVSFEMMPSRAPTGQRNRQYRFLTNTVASSSSARPIHMAVVPKSPNIQNGSTYRYTATSRVAMKYASTTTSNPYLIHLDRSPGST